MPRVSLPTKADFEEILRRVTPREYHEPILADPRGSSALYRAFAKTFAVLAEKVLRTSQAAF